MREAFSSAVNETEKEIFEKLKKNIHEGVCSIKDDLAKLIVNLVDNDKLQEKLDEMMFRIKYDDFKREINKNKQEAKEYQEDAYARTYTQKEEITFK